jgi:uncharacterized LabA/DUF88 family protein
LPFNWSWLETEKLLLGAAFSLFGIRMSVRTSIFVDGYNLYYGCIRNTTYKWLDIVTWCDQMLAQRSQNEVASRVHLCTAYANGSFAGHGQASVEAQSSYLRALQAQHASRLSILFGSHVWNRQGTPMPVFNPSEAYDRHQRVLVWKIEEKQTDVNLALAMYRDCSKGLCDRIILVSNDSDAAPALQAIKEDFPHIMRGLVLPVPALLPGSVDKARRKSGSLQVLSDWHLPSISNAQLEAAQLPPVIPVPNKKPIRKPAHW